MTNKPVWRALNNDGQIPLNVSEVVYTYMGELYNATNISGFVILKESRHVGFVGSIFYQTTRAKEAKCNKKPCYFCDNKGYLIEVIVDRFGFNDEGFRTCPDCNGKGYQLELKR